MSDPNFTPAEYRAQVESMREIFRIYPPDFAACSFSAGVTGGMLEVAAKRIEALNKIIADDEHKAEFWELWCKVYDGPLAWHGRTAFDQIIWLQCELDDMLITLKAANDLAEALEKERDALLRAKES